MSESGANVTTVTLVSRAARRSLPRGHFSRVPQSGHMTRHEIRPELPRNHLVQAVRDVCRGRSGCVAHGEGTDYGRR